MSFHVNSDQVPYYRDHEADNSTNNTHQQELSLNINERNNQKNLLYEALFMPDKSSHTGGTLQSGSSINKNISTSGFITPPSKQDNSDILQGLNRWNTSSSLSSLSDSLIANPNGSQSLSSASSWNSLTHLPSSETFPSTSNDLDQRRSTESLFQNQPRSRESPVNLNFEPARTYTSMSESSSGSLQVLNNQCYEAAITERVKPTTREKYIAKMKQLKNVAIRSKGLVLNSASQSLTSQSKKRHHSDTYQHHQHHHQHQQHHHQRDHHHKDRQTESTSTISQKMARSSSLTEKDGVTDFVVPSTLAALSAQKSESSKSTLSSSGDNTDHKKHRYNQTFLALRQSGLMKTTIKTAELLRRSRSLQQELAKLRRDTNLFVDCVLKNPQNKLLKEHMEQHRNLNNSTNQQHQ